MREILFRGKRIDNGEWVEGCYAKFYPNELNSPCYMIFTTDEQSKCSQPYGIDPETVCQYTGLTDKNGREIFENDICKDSENISRILWNDSHQWSVEILKTDNVLSRGLVFPLWQYDNCMENGNRKLEVIGNIFDNPELLKTE